MCQAQCQSRDNHSLSSTGEQIKDTLDARQAGTSWPEHLSWVLLGYMLRPRRSAGVSSAEAVFGWQLVLPGELPSEGTTATYFLEQIKSPPVMCQPCTYAEVATQPPAVALMEARHMYERCSGAVQPLEP